jgi:hypothetical protein
MRGEIAYSLNHGPVMVCHTFSRTLEFLWRAAALGRRVEIYGEIQFAKRFWTEQLAA